MFRPLSALVLAAAFFSAASRGQSTSPLPDAPPPAPDAPTIRNLPRNFLRGEADIWTSPLRMSEGEGLGTLLFIAAAGAVGSEDRHVMQQHFLDKSTNDHANTASTGLTGLFMAAPVAFYGIGHMRHNQDAEQTGMAGAEAILDSVAVNQVFKIVSRRERPTLDNARGKFFRSGIGFDSAFASNHSVIAWSSAAVIASEYSGWLTKVTVYGLATGVSLSRVVGRDHFPSDVLVGSAMGWMIGRYVHRRHHRETDM